MPLQVTNYWKDVEKKREKRIRAEAALHPRCPKAEHEWRRGDTVHDLAVPGVSEDHVRVQRQRRLRAVTKSAVLRFERA